MSKESEASLENAVGDEMSEISDLFFDMNVIETPDMMEIRVDNSKVKKERKSERRIESHFKYEDYEQYINLDCIKCDPKETNPSFTPFDSIRSKMTNVTKDGKIKKLIVKGGTTKVKANSIVYLHYNSYFEMDEVPFDSSYVRNQTPFRLHLGVTSVYSGFAIAVMSMKEGEKSQFLIEPEYAFGKMGVPPRILPNATILLCIEILNIVECGTLVRSSESGSVNETNYEYLFNNAKVFHTLGNDNFSCKKISQAIKNYTKAKHLLRSYWCKNQDEVKKTKDLLLKVYVNLAICNNHPKINSPHNVRDICREALFTLQETANDSSKLFYNLGKAQVALGNYRNASASFNRAWKLQPYNNEIIGQIRLLEQKKAKYLEIEKSMYQKAFGFTRKPENPPKSKVVSQSIDSVIVQDMTEFKNSERTRMCLPAGLTDYERGYIKKVSEELGLLYSEKEVNEKLTIVVSK